MGDRSVKPATLISASALTSTGSSSSVTTGKYHEAVLVVNVTAASGTTPICNFQIEVSLDDDTFVVHPDFQVPLSFVTTGTKVLHFTGLGEYVRLAYTISGTSPSFTTTAKISLKN